MKKIGILAVAMAMAFLLVGVASAEMYLEAYLGGAQASNSQLKGNFQAAPSAAFPGGIFGALGSNGDSGAQVLGGIKLGTWFVKEGFAGYSGYPDWMKYFGIYTDFSYQNLAMRNQRADGVFLSPATGATAPIFDGLGGHFRSDGMIATWAFMLAGRYGFLPDSEVPFGRLQPYIGVGPAIYFSNMSPKFLGQRFNAGTIVASNVGTAGSTNLGFAADAGIRYMCLKNVSIDISFKYRYAPASYSFDGTSDFTSFKLDPTFNLFSGQLGVAYHF